MRHWRVGRRDMEFIDLQFSYSDCSLILVIDLEYPAMEKPINNNWFYWDVQTNSQTYPLLVIIQALTRVPLQSLCDKRSWTKAYRIDEFNFSILRLTSCLTFGDGKRSAYYLPTFEMVREVYRRLDREPSRESCRVLGRKPHREPCRVLGSHVECFLLS